LCHQLFSHGFQHFTQSNCYLIPTIASAPPCMPPPIDAKCVSDTGAQQLLPPWLYVIFSYHNIENNPTQLLAWNMITWKGIGQNTSHFVLSLKYLNFTPVEMEKPYTTAYTNKKCACQNMWLWICRFWKFHPENVAKLNVEMSNT